MRYLTRLVAGLRALLARKRVDEELDEELRGFWDASVDAKVAAGLSRQEASRAARIELGSPAAVKDWVGDAGWETRFDNALRDIRYAVRMLRRAPAFSAAAIATFALGIGANTAIFSIVDAAVLKPLPYEQPDRLVRIRFQNSRTGRTTDGMMPRDFLDWREKHQVFEHIALTGGGAFALLDAGEPEEVRIARVSSGFFEMFRIGPMLGRIFTTDDEIAGRDAVVILSHSFWKTRFGATPDVVGRTLRLDGKLYEIVGVMPERLRLPGRSAKDDSHVPAVRVHGDGSSARRHPEHELQPAGASAGWSDARAGRRSHESDPDGRGCQQEGVQQGLHDIDDQSAAR